MDMAIIRWHRYGVQTFKHPGAFSRYTLLNKRSVSMPELRQIGQPTIVEGMYVEDQRAFYEYTCSRCFHDYQMQPLEQDGKRAKRSKSTSAIDTTLLEPLHMLKAKGREGVVTFGYQTISMDDISPIQQTEPPMN